MMIETSKKDASAIKGIIVVGAILALMIGFTIYRWLDIGMFPRMQLELYAEGILLGLLVVRCVPSYEYKLEDKVLTVVKHGIIGNNVYNIPYQNIFGLYKYQAQLGGSMIKFRRTMRLNSALDGRDIWTLIYTVQNKNKKENVRMYLKMSQEFLEALNQKLSSKVKI